MLVGKSGITSDEKKGCDVNCGPTTTTTTIFIRAQKIYSVNINTRKKKLQRKRAQPLRNSKLIELSGWAKRKKICKYPKLTYNYGHILPFTQTRAHTNNNKQGEVHMQNVKCVWSAVSEQDGRVFLSAIIVFEFFCIVSLSFVVVLVCYSRSAGENSISHPVVWSKCLMSEVLPD